jgi:uracil-DNA glycosylase family 4
MEIGQLIEALNREIRECHRCTLAHTRTNALCGEGNLHAQIMLIAQAPGKNEDREGRMFIGPSGKVLDELLGTAGIERREIYMTNLIKCMLPKCRRPKSEEIEICSKYLDREIELINARVMAPLGYYATRYVLMRHNILVPAARADFQALYGSLLLAQNQKILPLPHPAALLYDNSFKPRILEKYRKLKVLSRPCKWYPLCPMKRLYKRGELDRQWIELFCKGDWESCFKYQMEEHGGHYPDSGSPNANPGQDRDKALEPEATNESI